MSKENLVSSLSVSYAHSYRQKAKVASVQEVETAFRRMLEVSLISAQRNFCVLFLNSSSEVLGFKSLSVGSLSNSFYDLQQIFGYACKTMSTSLVLAYSSPDGDLEFTDADVDVYCRIREISGMLGMSVLDFMLIAPESYVSLSEMGIM